MNELGTRWFVYMIFEFGLKSLILKNIYRKSTNKLKQSLNFWKMSINSCSDGIWERNCKIPFWAAFAASFAYNYFKKITGKNNYFIMHYLSCPFCAVWFWLSAFPTPVVQVQPIAPGQQSAQYRRNIDLACSNYKTIILLRDNRNYLAIKEDREP